MLRPKKVKENVEDYSFTYNNQRPLIGSMEAKRITSLVDAKGVSIVATKEILSSREKPDLLFFSIIPVSLDEKKNSSFVTQVQDLVSCFTTNNLKVCLYFLQIKSEYGLVDTPVMQFDGMTPAAYKEKYGYAEKVPIAAAVAYEHIKMVCLKTSIPLDHTVVMGMEASGCLVVNMAFSQYSEMDIAGYCCLDSYLPRNFSIYSQFCRHRLLNKKLFMSNLVAPELVPSTWGNETFHDLRNLGLRPSSSCYFSIRNKSASCWDHVRDWIECYIFPQIEGHDVVFRKGRRVSWAPEDVLEDYIEYEIDSDDDCGYEHDSESLQSLVVGF